MAREDDVGSSRIRLPVQELIARRTRGSGEAADWLLAIPAHDTMRYPVPIAKLGNLLRFARRLRPQPVIDGHSDKFDGRKSRLEPGFREEKEGSRVAAAGDRGDECAPICQVDFEERSKKISFVAQKSVSGDRICRAGVSTPLRPSGASSTVAQAKP